MERAGSVNPVPEADDVSGEKRIRASTYALLAALLAESPKRELIQQVAAIDASESEPDSLFGKAWRSLGEALAAAPKHLDDEYHALFIGLGRGELVPYGSWYITGFMMDKPLATLRADLSHLGFERSGQVFETEDHACALLEVMAMIVDEGHGLGSQRHFLLPAHRFLDGEFLPRSEGCEVGFLLSCGRGVRSSLHGLRTRVPRDAEVTRPRRRGWEGTDESGPFPDGRAAAAGLPRRYGGRSSAIGDGKGRRRGT